MKVSSGPGRKSFLLPTLMERPSRVGELYCEGDGLFESSARNSAQPPLSERNIRIVLSSMFNSLSFLRILPMPWSILSIMAAYTAIRRSSQVLSVDVFHACEEEFRGDMSH